MPNITITIPGIEKLLALFERYNEPAFARREMEAKLIRAQGDHRLDEFEISAGRRIEELRHLAGRALTRVSATEIRRQENVESIQRKALTHVPENVSDEPVDPDWFAAFVSSAQDVSNEAMQQFWARLLAGKVAEPAMFSLRTMHVLRTMSQREAELFAQFTRYFIRLFGNDVHLRTGETDQYLATQGIRQSHLDHLETIGLISPSRHVLAKDKRLLLVYNGQAYSAQTPEGFPVRIDSPPVRILELTEAGAQIAYLAQPIDHDRSYWDAIEAGFRARDIALSALSEEHATTLAQEVVDRAGIGR